MGFVYEQPSYTISFRDGSDTTGWIKGYLASGGSAAGYLDAVAGLAVRMQAISDAVLVRYAVNFPIRNTDAIIAASRVPIPALARFIFTVDPGPDTYWSVVLPYKPEWVLTDGPLAGVGLDLTNSEIVSLESEIVSAPFLDQFGNAITALVAAFIEETV